MSTFNRKDFDEFLKMYICMKAAAFDVLKEYCRITGECADFFDEITDIDDCHVTFAGEIYRHDGHEHFSLEMPVEFVFCEKSRKKYVEEFARKKRKEEEELKRRAIVKAEISRKKRLQEFEKLKKEFEG